MGRKYAETISEALNDNRIVSLNSRNNIGYEGGRDIASILIDKVSLSRSVIRPNGYKFENLSVKFNVTCELNAIIIIELSIQLISLRTWDNLDVSIAYWMI